jgi:PAS domain S-box-containing protein
MTPATLLIVEDDSILAADLEVILSTLGYLVRGPVATGEEALALLEHHRVDLVLMDIELAGELNGIETAARLARSHDIPVVFLTGFSHDPLLEQARVAAPYGYLIKPVAERELAATIAMALHRHALDRQLEESRRLLAESERRHRHYLQSTPYSVFAVNQEGRFLEVNPSACRITGYSQAELLTMSIADLHCDSDRELGLAAFRTALAGGRAEAELPFRTRDGQRRWWSVTAVRAEDGRVLGFCNDVTERRRAEEQLRENEANIRLMLDGMEESVTVIAADGTILFANRRSALNYTGNAETGLVGKNIAELLPKEQAEFHLAAFREVISSRQLVIREVMVPKDDGERCYLNRLQPLDYGREHNAAVLSISLDITERRQFEDERKRLQTQLAHAQKMEAIGTLAGGIAHDFNNILGAVIGYTELAREDCTRGSEISQNLDRVLEAGKRAAALVGQILAFSRRQDSDRISLLLGPIVKEVVKLLRPMLPTTIAIIHRVDSERFILADPTQVHQVIMNLATNAFHAMEQSGGRLEIAVRDVEYDEAALAVHPGVTPGPFVRLTVADSGAGIPAEIRERIFDPYFTTKEVGKGTGMGLAIVDGIVRSSGGFLTCDSEIGRGSVFAINWPACPSEDATPVEPAEGDDRGQGHILLVDDEELLVSMTQSMLRRLGYEVTACTDSLQALRTFEGAKERFDAVVTDQTMPGMTGLDMARRMLELRPGLPIILCTGYSNLVNEAQARECGIKAFAAKPLTKKGLARLLRELLRPAAT